MSDAHIILAGQSNALGYLNTGPAPYTATARVQIWTDTNGDGAPDAWNYMRPGVNTGTAANPNVWGAEVELANRWLADHPSGYLWIVKEGAVKGSTGLAQDANQLDWSPHSRGEMYDQATATIHAAQANLQASAFAFKAWDAVAWSQGETDATDPAKAAAYGANLTELIADARRDWGVEDFVVSRISDTGAASLAVRQAEWAVDQADPHAASFKTIGFGLQPDLIHYDAAGQMALGDGFYDGWVTLA
jgi:hypothetical protein